MAFALVISFDLSAVISRDETILVRNSVFGSDHRVSFNYTALFIDERHDDLIHVYTCADRPDAV